MTRVAWAIALAAMLVATTKLGASGPVGIYGIIDKVVLEPNDRAPERIQVWGAFAYVNGGTRQDVGTSVARRGYLYFKLPSAESGVADHAHVELIRREWADLKAVAGTGQAVGFGQWGYIGLFESLQPDRNSGTFVERTSQGGGRAPADLRVRPATETPRSPATYQTNAGLIKLTEHGSRAAIVASLRSAS